MDDARKHALLSYILEGMSPEEGQRALVALSSMAQGDPNTLPVQLALFMKGAAKAMQEAGDRIASVKEEAPKLIEESFAKGLLKQEELQHALTGDIGKFLPQVEKINKGMENVPFALKQLSVCAAKAEIAAGEAKEEASQMRGNLGRFAILLIVAVVVGVVLGCLGCYEISHTFFPPLPIPLTYTGTVKIREVTSYGATGTDTETGQIVFISGDDTKNILGKKRIVQGWGVTGIQIKP